MFYLFLDPCRAPNRELSNFGWKFFTPFEVSLKCLKLKMISYK